MNNFTFGDDRFSTTRPSAAARARATASTERPRVHTHMTNSRLTDPEVLEWRFPVLIEEHSIRAGSGGAGRWRGGDGALRRIRFLAPMTAAILAGHRIVAPYGMAGGGDGQFGKTWVERVDGTRQVLSYSEQTEMSAGRRVRRVDAVGRRIWRSTKS